MKALCELNFKTETEIVSSEQHIKCFHAYWLHFHATSMKSEIDAAAELKKIIQRAY